MINLQNPQIPAPIKAIEIDRAIYELQLLLSTNLSWLSHAYGRAYRFVEKTQKRLYLPEVYQGAKSYTIVTPDNDKKGTCFFVVGREENWAYEPHQVNNLRFEVGIIFWVNLAQIDASLLANEVFTQNLIKDARQVLTQKGGGLGFSFKIKNVEREFKQVYKEFTMDEANDYHRAPYDGFRLNLELVVAEDCGALMFDPKEALINSLSGAEKVAILQSLDFADNLYYSALTAQQRADLGI